MKKIINLLLIISIIFLLFSNFTLVNNKNFLIPYFSKYNANLKNVILRYLKKAKKSIYIACYNLSDKYIAKQLVKLHKKGVYIKIVIDDKYKRKKAIQFLKRNGIKIVYDKSKKNFMHNKFIIIDRKIVLVGSVNLNYTALKYDDNNLLAIKSQKLARNYINEFFEMYKYKLFSQSYLNNTKKEITINKTKLINIFTPDDNGQYYIKNLLNSAKKSIYIAAFIITDKEIIKILNKKANQGVKIYILLEKESYIPNYKYGFEHRTPKYKFYIDSLLNTKNIYIKYDGNENHFMHNKFIVVDNKIIETGSYNYSWRANNVNDENFLIIYNKNLALKYKDYFNWLFKKGKRYY